MLALTRKKGESIMIGSDVEVVILGVSGEQVKLGINAPRNISIHRKEIYEQIQKANITAAQSVKFDIDAIKNIAGIPVNGDD